MNHFRQRSRTLPRLQEMGSACTPEVQSLMDERLRRGHSKLLP